jgi:hypothetical protein
MTISYFSPELSRFPPKFYYWAFWCCDAVSLAFQATGAGLASTSSGTSQIGVNLALAGLAFQVLVICIFCGLFIDFFIRYFRSSNMRKIRGQRLETFFLFLSLALVLITVRSVFRLYELHQGFRGDSMKNEGLFIGIEGV